MAWKHEQFACLFCLKIFKQVTSFANHAWRHWNRRVFPCSKCWLQSLNLKEKTEIQTKNHQSFKQPEHLRGLPPETEVMIQSSVQLALRETASIIVRNTDSHVPPRKKTQKRLTMNTKYSRHAAAWDLAKNYVLPTSRNSKKPHEIQPAVHKDPAWLSLFSCSVLSDSL